MFFSRCKTIKEFINLFNAEEYREGIYAPPFELDEYDDEFYFNNYKFKLSDKFDKKFWSKFMWDDFTNEDFEKARTSDFETVLEDYLERRFAMADNTLCFKHKCYIAIIRCVEYSTYDLTDSLNHHRIWVKTELPLKFYKNFGKLK